MTDPTSAPQQPARRLGDRALVAACTLGGLLLGLLLSFVVAHGSEPEYSASSNYALLPAVGASGETLGQISFLTPVFAAQANDPATADEVKAQLGGRAPASVASTTIPDSQLLFTISAAGTDPKLVFDTLAAYEKVLLAHAAAGQPVSAKTARLQVVARASEPTTPDSMSPKVILGAGSIAGACVGLALGLGLLRRRRGDVHTGSHTR